jgi:membrane-bound serine protease (ClpP class)
MSEFDSDFDSDVEMEERLKRFAASTRTPPLPEGTTALPWTVQGETPETGPFGFRLSLAGLSGRAGRALAAGTRLAVTLAVAGGLLFLVSSTRTSGSGAGLIEPTTPRPTQQPGAPGGPQVVVLPTHGVVDGVMASYVAGGVKQAESDGAAAVIIQLDTLGGASDAMESIVQSLHATIPTIVWVGPSGAKAASAGTFITLSANLAYMAPSTNIGAASPVAAGGQDIASVYGQTEADKVMNDAVNYIKSIAQERHPQAVDWAISTVQQAKSYSAQEALDAHAINGIASSLDEVLKQADGQEVTINGAQVVVHTSGATIKTIDEDFIQTLLHDLDDPNIAFILLVLGVLCVAIEFFHPTVLVGLTGAFCLALAFYGAGSLPLNILGVILVVLGIVMLILEPAVPSHGLLTVGGIVSFVIGAVAFYGSPGPYLPAASVAWPIIAVMTAAAAAYGLVIVRTLLALRNRPVPEGVGLVGSEDEVVGKEGVVERDLDPSGTVYVARESWSAILEGGESAPRGTKVRVIRKEGLTLVVEPVK